MVSFFIFPSKADLKRSLALREFKGRNSFKSMPIVFKSTDEFSLINITKWRKACSTGPSQKMCTIIVCSKVHSNNSLMY